MTKKQLRDAADIVLESVSARQYGDILGLPIRRGFTNCPFHSGDRDASLKLYDGRKGFHCFGCGANGDVIEFARQYYGLTFPQAIAKVADDAGIELPSADVKMTYEQAQAFETAKENARKRREELERQQAEEQEIEEEYLATLDEYLAINDHFKMLEGAITVIVLAGLDPGELIMRDFFRIFAAKLAIDAAMERIETRRMGA